MCIFRAVWAKGSFWCKRHICLSHAFLRILLFFQNQDEDERRLCPTQRRHSPTKKRYLPTTFWPDFDAALYKTKVIFEANDAASCFCSKRQKSCTPGGLCVEGPERKWEPPQIGLFLLASFQGNPNKNWAPSKHPPIETDINGALTQVIQKILQTEVRTKQLTTITIAHRSSAPFARAVATVAPPVALGGVICEERAPALRLFYLLEGKAKLVFVPDMQ